ncbi:polyprenyl synthetase family protein [Nocardia seriolae]|nr:polyprenyl synthetase family protein [Nocardia seriolae]MTJ70781.1 polyprenyl synthetase family protein [Nocardia seriolae]MTJ87202.1 polyprenyl synthetase family protein [Nocardia seriolae]MTK31196.1 polyprenyl synthetase family protein [Nocardia seriolae]MTK40247.1 polyprenyl synthetase family protein [Nocardia seriolae]
MSAGPGTPTRHAVGAGSLVAAVEERLNAFFVTRGPIVEPLGPVFVDAARALQDFVIRGGKRTRPSFAWTGWLGAGRSAEDADADAVLTACSALELVQACALIHDDIIDSSRTRRGFPTVHVDYEQRHRDRRWRGDAAHYGESVAVLIGDLALAWADDMTRDAGLPADAAARFAPVWAAMRTEVLGGQLLDIYGESAGDETVEAALRINRYKTAAYTIERPLHLGAALADASPELVAAYREFGTDIGIAFQLRDDLLGVFGDPAVTGKPSGDDLREGKRTVLIAEALQRADADAPAVADLVRSSLGTDVTPDRVAELRTAITELGAVDAVEKRIAALTDQALTALDASTATPEAKRQLRAMALAATARSY